VEPSHREKLYHRYSEINKYYDKETNLYRYSKFVEYTDENGDTYKYIEGFQTITVLEETSFEEASSKSIYNKDNINQNKKNRLKQYLLGRNGKSTGCVSKWLFEDGSLMTTASQYRK
jgi:hypothetical protein